MLLNAYQVFKDYLKLATPLEKRIEFTLSVLIMITLFAIIYSNFPTLIDLRNFSVQVLNFVITILSVLSGFNVASVSIISSSQSPIITSLRDKKVKRLNYKYNEFQQLVNFFCWAIIVQLGLLMCSVLFYFCISFISIPWYLTTITLLLISTFSIYSILLSIKNVSILYLFLFNSNGN